MLRLLVLLAACFVPIGCCSQFGNCGTRVPPPGTGSYGVPNTYYPAATPRTSSVTPSSSNSLSEWRSVSEPDQNKLVDLSPPTSDEPIGTGAKAPRVLTTAATTGKSIDRSSPSIRSRLNGMPVNEAKSSVSPASFQAPLTPSDSTGDSAPGNVVPKTAAPKSTSSNSLGGDSAALRTDSWQSRSAPAPNRFAGG